MNKRALITGISGQDGSYLKELLLEKGYEVHGLYRRSSTIDYDSVKDVIVHYGDLSDVSSLRRAIAKSQPHELYNLGAQSHVRISYESPSYTVDVNARGVLHLLEAIKDTSPDTRFYQAGSSEMFGKSEPPQNEETAFKPQSPYSCAKLYAHHQVINFRDAYGIFACNGISFNHESPRRGENFVTRKITKAAARISKGLQEDLKLGRLDTSRDWGFAPDYVEAMWTILQADTPGDYIIATGQLHTVKDFVKAVFEYLNLDWEQYVVYDPSEERPDDVVSLRGDASKIRNELGWQPTVMFDELVQRMVDAELNEIKG